MTELQYTSIILKANRARKSIQNTQTNNNPFAKFKMERRLTVFDLTTCYVERSNGIIMI